MKVAVVTGANRGIGLATVRSLIPQFEGHVYLTSRSEAKGMEAVARLKEEYGLKAHFCRLDTCDEASVLEVRDAMVARYGGIDVLVNNAGMAFKVRATDPFGHQARL